MLKRERGKDFIHTLTLFVVAIVALLLDWRNGLQGGVSTVGAERVLAGDLPYRDFWTMYAPGQFYLLALVYKIFGTHYLAEAVSASVICAAAASLCYLLVRNLEVEKPVALVCAIIFLAAIYNTGYHKNLGSYPTSILFILLGLNCIARFYKDGRRKFLLMAGFATGATVVFKHDIGAYTALAIVTGLVVHHFAERFAGRRATASSLLSKLGIYSAGVAIIALPVFTFFAVKAWPEMVQDLVVFPLTDFRYARPESYPSLSPLTIFDASRLKTLENLCRYVIFAMPLLLIVSGFVAIGSAFRNTGADRLALCATFLLAYFFHYTAAHVQINTHIISMTVYGSFLGAIFWEFARRKYFSKAATFSRLFALALASVWLLSLMAAPAYKIWSRRGVPTTVLSLPKVSGFKLPSEDARNLSELSAFVNANISADQPIFAGLHRHDVVVFNDVMLYFILNRPVATRYQELHPAITDTAPIQREIIGDLERKKIPLIVIKQLFSDQILEAVKKDFLKNLPKIGAAELDNYIRENYFEARRFGQHQVWLRKENAAQVSPQ